MAKGQVTIFIILGIILLLGAGLLVYVVMQNSDVETTSPSQSAGNALEVYVNSCLLRGVQEGLEIMRMQGGHINIPIGARTVEVEDSQTIVDLPEGKRLIARPGTNKIAYWKDETGYVAFPTFEKMQEELSLYVSNYVENCVDDFTPFQEDGYEIVQEIPEANVVFGSSVVVQLDFPVRLTKGGDVLEQDTYSYAIPIDMERIYGNAYLLMRAQETNSFLEHHLSKIISLYGYVGQTNRIDIPPLSLGLLDSKCDEKEWQLPIVENQLNMLFEENIPLLQIARTNISRWSINEDASCKGEEECIAQGTLDGFIKDYLPEDNQIHVGFSLVEDDENIFYDVRPRSGDTIKGDTTEFPPIFMASSSCYTRFAFKYTANIPILITVQDDWSDRTQLSVGNSDEKFVFRYVVGTNLCGNQESGCNYPQNPLFFVNANSQFCSDPQAGPIQVDVLDALTFEPVPDAKLVYTCGSELNTCSIGRTDANGEIMTAFPYCINGVLYAEQSGYEEKISLLSTDSNPAHYQIKLFPKHELETKYVLVHLPTFLKDYYLTNGFTQNSCSGENPEVLLKNSLREVKAEDGEFITGLLKTGTSRNTQVLAPPTNASNPPSISISPSLYDVSISYVATGVIVEDSQIEGKKITYGTTSGTQDVPLGNVDFEWEAKNIYDASSVTFYIPVEGFKEESFDAKKLVLNPIHQGNEFSMRIDFEENSIPSLNCANNPLNNRLISIQEAEFGKLMEPLLE